MKRYFLPLVAACVGAVIGFSVKAQTLYNGVGHIPTYYQERWNNAGLLRDMSSVEPKLVINFENLSGDDDQKMTTALADARGHVSSTGGLAIIYFPTGTYYLTNTIELTQNDSNIVFQGAGSDRTTLEFQYMKDDPCFNMTGTAGTWSDLDHNFNKGDSIVHAPAGGLSSISVGDWLHFVKYRFDYGVPPPELELDIVGQITRLEAKGTDGGGDWGEIKDVANMNYIDSENTEYSLKVRQVTPVQNIGIENLTINRYPSEQATVNVYNIHFAFAVNCWVKGVESYKASRHHMKVGYSSHVEISGCYFHEAEHYGNGGWGYGVEVYSSSTNCLIENNIFRKLRHAMVAAGGSNCNVWTFNYSREQTSSGIPPTYRDLDLHAKYPFGHLFEHNMIEFIESDGAHGDNGPYNAFVRNFVHGSSPLRGYVHIISMSAWSTLGNIDDDDLLRAAKHDYEELAIKDVFGFLANYTSGYSHNVFRVSLQREAEAELLDVSYYYSERPEFLTGGYT